MKTLFDLIYESKADDEYNKSWSTIDREIFNTIVRIDPKTTITNNEINTIGFVAKQLLLPKYKEGEVEFLNDIEAVKAAITKYQASPGNYAKLPLYKTVAEFVKHVNDPTSVDIQETPVIDPITKIYNEYYSDIDREDFDKIIAMDPKTTAEVIGEIAKNLLLASYRKKENILDKTEDITDACKIYYRDKNKIPVERQQLTAYASVDDFINFITSNQESTLVASLKNNSQIDPKTNTSAKDSFRLVASTLDYDILEPLSSTAAIAIGGGYTSSNGMKWCTGWEENRSYWKRYTENGGRLFCFMHKQHYRGYSNRVYNWQIQVIDDQVQEFLNGHDSSDYQGKDVEERFKNFLYAHIDIYNAIKNKEPFNTLPLFRELKMETEVLFSGTFVVDSMLKVSLLETTDRLSKSCEEIIISIPKIPAALCADFLVLKKVTFQEGVKEIGDQAFMNCTKLENIIFPNSLEIIKKEAFQNCLSLKGAIRIPDNVTEIRTAAFGRGSCKLKLNRDRKNKIKFDARDKDWVSTHVQLITIDR